MPKIFLSYRRKSWPFTHRLTDELAKRLDADLFVDFTGVDEADFEKSILGHLRTSDAVLLVISEHTFADRIHKDDDWVRREIREALISNIPLVLICVEGLLPPSGLPDDIKDVARMQGINFYPDYFMPGVEKLAEFVVKIKAATFKTASPVITSPPDEKVISAGTLGEALDLLENGDPNKAIFLLESLRDAGFKSRTFDIEDLLKQAHREIDLAERQRSAELDYDEIVILDARKITQTQARTAFEKWRKEYSELVEKLDTKNLRERYKSIYEQIPPAAAPPKPVRSKVFEIFHDALPFDWVEIPKGVVTLGGNTGANSGYIKKATEFPVEAFSIAKYPITNKQFQLFVNASNGYANVTWWKYSPDAAAWHKKNPKPQDRAFPGDDHPRANVTWYEAIAFCQWLSAETGEKITLPTDQQWQWAAQALRDGRDSGYTYPWGKDWDATRCNNNVDSKGIGKTTPVTQYEGKGDSPCGVVDMAGNVWEWCLTEYETGKNDTDGTSVRVLRGGSWWNGSTVNFRVDYRLRSDPNDWDNYGGFRLSRFLS